MLLRPNSAPGRTPRRFRFGFAALLPLLGLAACETHQELVTSTENNLSAAGFVARPASTPELEEMLHKLPPEHFVQRTRAGALSYVFADPLVCNCLYVGTPQAYNNYRYYMQQKQIADERQLTAEMYSDPDWNWSAWGGGGPGFGYGPGFGW